MKKVRLGKGKGKSLPFSGVHRLTQTDPLIETVYSNSLFLTSLKVAPPSLLPNCILL